MPISIPSSATVFGVTITIEIGPSQVVYLNDGISTRVYVSMVSVETNLPTAPAAAVLQERNLPYNTSWATVTPLNNNGTGLYYADVPWEGKTGKGELQAFAYNATGGLIGSAYKQFFLDRYNQ